MLTRLRYGMGFERQRGLSLVEIMVALALGAVITVGIVQMFTANRATYQINMGQARLQENGRFAMDFLAPAIRNGGYTGCSSRASIFNALNPVDGEIPLAFDMGEPITGFMKASEGQAAPSALPGDIPWDDIPAGSDVLILKSVDGDGLSLVADMPDSSAVIFSEVPDDLGIFDSDPPPILMITDCTKGAVFQVTHSGETGNGFQVQHNQGQGEPGNRTQRLAQDDEGFGADAAVYTLNTQYFYVAPGEGTNIADETVLSLWRIRGTQREELVEGIEMLQVLYGESTDGNRVPNRYRRIDDVNNRDNIVTLRVNLRANSVNRVTEDGDGLLRRDFTKTVALRNRI